VTSVEAGVLIDGHRTTDAGNADRLIAATDGRVRYVHAWGQWIVWRDGRWWIDYGDALVTDAAKTVARALFALIPTLNGDAHMRDEVWKWARRCESSATITNMIRLARGVSSVLTDHNQLDADPWALNCRNGTVDLTTGQLRDHNPDDLCTLQAPIMYDPDARCATFEAVVARALPDPEVRAFFQRWAGTAITGIPVQALMLCVGPGANSKSVIMESLQRSLGDGYAVVPHKSLLVAGRHEQHPTHLASLKGARLVVAPETEAGDRLNEELIKTLTGGDRLRARRMRQDEWSFSPTWSAAMHTNHLPRIRGTDEGIWRRLHHVPFGVTIPLAERDETLVERIAETELAGIINWCLVGVHDWLERDRRLDPPHTVGAATDSYRATQDHLGRFIAAHCVLGETLYVSARDLRQAYEAWCDDEGERAWTAKAVGEELARRGCDSARLGRAHTHSWLGIGLLTPEAPPDLPLPL